MNTDRNIGIISPEEQQKIGDTSIAVLGLGMGSVISELLVRTGFSNILIADGDVIDSANLNRQNYLQKDVGKFKADVTGERLRQINPEVNLLVLNQFISKENIDVINNYDIIVDTIDLSSYDIIKLVHEEALRQNKTIIFPFNLGWKSVLFVFNNTSQQIESLLKVEPNQINSGNFEDWAKFIYKFVPEYGIERYDAFIKKAMSMSDWCPAPQLGVTVHMGAALTSTIAVKIATGEEVKYSPYFYEIDSYIQ